MANNFPSTTVANLTKVSSDSAITGVAGHRVFRVELIATTDAGTLALYDAASITGTALWNGVARFTGANGGGAHNEVWDWTHLGGILFPSIGIYADIGGTSAVAYVWWQ